MLSTKGTNKRMRETPLMYGLLLPYLFATTAEYMKVVLTLLCKAFGFNILKIEDSDGQPNVEAVKQFIKANLLLSTIQTENGYDGFILLKNGCANISHTYGSNGEVRVSFFLISKCPLVSIISPKKKTMLDNSLTVWQKSGHSFHLQWFSSNWVMNATVCKETSETQSDLVEQIIATARRDKYWNLRVLIHGKPGTGKSTVAKEIAKRLTGNLVIGHDPTTPSDNLTRLTFKLNPTYEKPMIVLIDEFDVMIQRLKDEKVKVPDNFLVEVSDVAKLLSYLDMTTYMRNVIFIFTTNKKLDWFEERIIRLGRIDLHKELTHDIVVKN